MAPDDTTSRRRILKLSGAAVAAAVGAGIASADHFHADVETDFATNVGKFEATLTGDLLDMGQASSVDVWFDWGEFGAGFPNSTPRQTRTSPGTFSANLDGLTPGVAYEFRARSDTGSTTETGGSVSFTTDDISPPPPPSCDPECIQDEL